MRSMGLPATSDFFMETGSGTLLHTYENEYPRGRANSWVKFQEIFCKGKTDKVVVVMRVESAIFDEMKPSLLRFLETVFSTVGARNAIQNDKPPVEISAVAVKRCRDAGLEGIGLIIGAILLKYSGPHHTYDEKLVALVNRHESMINETTLDTVAKVLAALNPLWGRLGFDCYRLTSQVNFSEEQFEMFEKDHELLDFFKKHLVVFSLHRNAALHPLHLQSMSEVDSSTIPKKLNGNSFEILENFLQLPVQDKTYRDYLLSLTVRDYLVLRDLKLVVIPSPLVFDVSRYLVDSAAVARTVDGVRSAHELYLMVFDSCLTTGVMKADIESYHKWLLHTAPEKPAVVQCMKALISDKRRVEEPCLIFKSMLEKLASRDVKWVDDVAFADFVISVLYKEVGVDKTLMIAQRVIDSGESVTAAQVD